MQHYCSSLTAYKRLPTREVKIGDLLLGNGNPIRIQTMTTTDTMDTAATVAQTIRCIEAGAELVRITAPSKNEAENLLNIKNELRARGYTTPLVADIHFTPNAAEIAARIVEKVRVNPGNYIDKKKFATIDYTDNEYASEVMRIRDRFLPLVKICKEYGTAMRIGTNHGSLSDRIMSRYGDTPIGMVESAMEFLRIARDESYHQVILSMKSSNPLVMVQAYRLLVQKMDEEFGECYPLHLGVTEAGDGEDGRIKSAIGIGTLLEDSRSHRDLLSPYMADVLDLVGPVGPAQAEAAETLTKKLHRQVQQRVFGKGYRLLLMPTMATPLVAADMFRSKQNKVEMWAGTGFAFALTWPWNLLNRYPVVNVPLGVVEDRMPSGMQAISQTFTDLDAFQFAFNWSRLRPPLFAGKRFPTFA